MHVHSQNITIVHVGLSNHTLEGKSFFNLYFYTGIQGLPIEGEKLDKDNHSQRRGYLFISDLILHMPWESKQLYNNKIV